MLLESTSLASLTGLLATALREEYGIDPGPVFADAGLPLSTAGSPRLRHPVARMRRLWELSKEASGDETIGLKTGQYAKPGYFYAFGHSWLASATLLDAMQRLTRYSQLISTAVAQVTLAETADSYALSTRFTEGGSAPPKEGIDCAMTALLALCDIAAEKEIRPLRVELTCRADVHPEAYREALRAPIRFGAEVGVFHFDKDVLTAPLPHDTPDIARATDKIAEEYVETLDPHKVASQVRRLLIAMLPSGNVSQDMVSSRLNRSKSTLQRQLRRRPELSRCSREHPAQSCRELPGREKTHACANRFSAGFLRPE